MALPITTGKQSERGFTLAGLIVILTVMMIFVAYTVPRQWSIVLLREREQQTIFVMKQYAEAIDAFERKNHVLPVSVEQLEKARSPRFLRGVKSEYPDPLTGEVDWLIIPASAAGIGVGVARPAGPTPTPGAGPSGQQTSTAPPGVPMKDYAGGPFIGIRPNKKGNSLIELNGAQKYEEWSYTVNDYRNERNALYAAEAKIWQ